jgi:hypothetical protein
MSRKKRGHLGTQEFNVGKRVVSSLRRTLALASAIRVPEQDAHQFASVCRVFPTADRSPRIPLLLRLLAKAALERADWCFIMLCGGCALEGPIFAAVPVCRAGWRATMVKHWCCAQWIVRTGDFLGSRARAGAANQRFHQPKSAAVPEKSRIPCWHAS